MKKLLALLLAVVMIFGLAACGGGATGDDGTEQAKATADAFMQALDEGDFAKASTYCSEDLQKELGFDTFQDELSNTMEQALLSSISGYTPSDEVKGVISDWCKDLMNIMIRGYEIKDVKKDGDNWVASGTVDVVDVTDTDSEEFYNLGQEIGTEAMQDYMAEHQDELTALYQEKGINALYDKVFADLLPTMFPKINEAFEKYDSQSSPVEITVSNQDGKYVITDVNDDLKNIGN